MQRHLARLADRFWKRDPARLAIASPEALRAQALCRRWPAFRAEASRPQTARTDEPLRRYFDANRAGPGIWKWEHYFEIYHRHLAKFIGTSAHLVEVGVFSGGSLGMWREYLGPQSRISGIDIEEACRTYAREGIDIFIGDQADRRFWAEFRDQAPPMDVVIDDGGHQPEQQMVTLEETLPYLRPGGVYVCEDIHGAGNRFAAFAHALAAQLNATHWNRHQEGLTASDPSPFQATVHSVHCYPFLVVIETQSVPLAALQAPRHGTQWQPFL